MAYSVKGLAQKWGCSTKHIYNQIAAGNIRTFSIGRCMRVSDKEVERCESDSTATAMSASGGQTAGTLRAGKMASRLVSGIG